MNIKILIISFIIWFSNVFCFSQGNINKVFEDSLMNIFPECIVNQRDSFNDDFMSRNTYALTQIASASIHLQINEKLTANYLGRRRVRKVKIYFCTERYKDSHGVNTYIYYDRKLVIYFLDRTEGSIISTVICDNCRMNPKKLDKEKYLIMYAEYSRRKGFFVKFIE